jgi:hypothetical protein
MPGHQAPAPQLDRATILWDSGWSSDNYVAQISMWLHKMAVIFVGAGSKAVTLGSIGGLPGRYAEIFYRSHFRT